MTIDFRDLDNAFTFNNTMRRDLLNNVLHLWAGIFLLNIYSEFNRFLLIFRKNKQKLIF